MNPLDWMEPEELLQFFHCNKTEMSCMENPLIFLCQLRDHNLIPEDQYQKVKRMKSKINIKKSLYDILDWFEENRSEHITLFWSCVFKEIIISQYPTLRLLRNSLMDGSFHFSTRLPEKLENGQTDERKEKELSESEEEEEEEEEQVNSMKKKRKRKSQEEEEQVNSTKNKKKRKSQEEEEQVTSTKKKRKRKSKSVCEDEELQPGPSSRLTQASPLKRGEQGDPWNWPLYKSQLPVTCGHKEGSLSRSRLAKGEKCILCDKQWFTPGEFEKLAGKSSSKNWKVTIRCMGTPLGKLIKEGNLESTSFKRQHKKTKRSLFSSDDNVTVSEGEEEDEDDENDQVPSSDQEDCSDEDRDTEDQSGSDQTNAVFKVTCGDETATLHGKRFVSGTCGKSIRTETKWLTPVEFVKAALGQPDAPWKKDIMVEGRPLNALIEEKILRIHSLLCTCRLCSPSDTDLENERNDDECYVCKGEEEEAELVVCDNCPRAFHQKCHLPHVDDATLSDSRPWVCTFCVFKKAQEWRYVDEMEMETVMSRHISGHMLECQYLLLFLHNADERQDFVSNPCAYLENYSSVIQTPMWLDKVADKLQEKEYNTVGEFVSDIQLIFTNCASYNHGNPKFLDLGDRLKETFSGEFKKVFNICEQC